MHSQSKKFILFHVLLMAEGLTFLFFIVDLYLLLRNLCLYICRVFIGIGKLLGLIDLVRQTEGDYRVAKFLSKLEEEDAIELRG
jgi:vesicle-fusing ATPase